MREELQACRGAICIREDRAELVESATLKLLRALGEANHLGHEDCVFALFSVTADIRSRNPATAARAAGWELPLFCVREAEFEGSPALVIRLLLAYRAETGEVAQHCYLDGAEKLRPDLFADQDFRTQPSP